MVDLATLIAACEKAVGLGQAALTKLRAARLSVDEEQLLSAGVGTGEFHLLTSEQIPGAIVRAGGEEFPKEPDPRNCARYVKAFEGLCERGYVRHEEGRLFRLTNAGYERAHKSAGGTLG